MQMYATTVVLAVCLISGVLSAPQYPAGPAPAPAPAHSGTGGPARPAPAAETQDKPNHEPAGGDGQHQQDRNRGPSQDRPMPGFDEQWPTSMEDNKDDRNMKPREEDMWGRSIESHEQDRREDKPEKKGLEELMYMYIMQQMMHSMQKPPPQHNPPQVQFVPVPFPMQGPMYPEHNRNPPMEHQPKPPPPPKEEPRRDDGKDHDDKPRMDGKPPMGEQGRGGPEQGRSKPPPPSPRAPVPCRIQYEDGEILFETDCKHCGNCTGRTFDVFIGPKHQKGNMTFCNNQPPPHPEFRPGEKDRRHHEFSPRCFMKNATNGTVTFECHGPPECKAKIGVNDTITFTCKRKPGPDDPHKDLCYAKLNGTTVEHECPQGQSCTKTAYLTNGTVKFCEPKKDDNKCKHPKLPPFGEMCKKLDEIMGGPECPPQEDPEMENNMEKVIHDFLGTVLMAYDDKGKKTEENEMQGKDSERAPREEMDGQRPEGDMQRGGEEMSRRPLRDDSRPPPPDGETEASGRPPPREMREPSDGMMPPTEGETEPSDRMMPTEGEKGHTQPSTGEEMPFDGAAGNPVHGVLCYFSMGTIKFNKSCPGDQKCHLMRGRDNITYGFCPMIMPKHQPMVCNITDTEGKTLYQHHCMNPHERCRRVVQHDDDDLKVSICHSPLNGQLREFMERKRITKHQMMEYFQTFWLLKLLKSDRNGPRHEMERMLMEVIEYDYQEGPERGHEGPDRDERTDRGEPREGGMDREPEHDGQMKPPSGDMGKDMEKMYFGMMLDLFEGPKKREFCGMKVNNEWKDHKRCKPEIRCVMEGYFPKDKTEVFFCEDHPIDVFKEYGIRFVDSDLTVWMNWDEEFKENPPHGCNGSCIVSEMEKEGSFYDDPIGNDIKSYGDLERNGGAKDMDLEKWLADFLFNKPNEEKPRNPMGEYGMGDMGGWGEEFRGYEMQKDSWDNMGQYKDMFDGMGGRGDGSMMGGKDDWGMMEGRDDRGGMGEGRGMEGPHREPKHQEGPGELEHVIMLLKELLMRREDNRHCRG